MCLGIGFAVETVADSKAEVAGLFFDLRGHDRRRRAGADLAGDRRAKVVKKGEPTVAAFEAPAHRCAGRVSVTVTEYFGVPLAQELVEVRAHRKSAFIPLMD